MGLNNYWGLSMKRFHTGADRALFLAACGAVLSLTLSASALAAEKSFKFGLWGDMPYEKAKDEPKIPALIASINKSDVKFSIYVGDIKDGSSKCTDDVYSKALTMFGQLKKPLVYIPGDNEWTDCHRTNNGGYHSSERLDYIRKTMFSTTGSLGQTKMPLKHQALPAQKFVENTRFVYNSIVFTQLNVPGSNNNKVLDDKDCTNKSARTPAICKEVNAEYEERDRANIEWMREAFKEAREKKAPGIVLSWQGEPGFDIPETEEVNERADPKVSGYTNFLNALVAETEKYAGQVLIVNGDVHAFKMDKPLFGPEKVLPNLTRIQTFGSPLIHWVKVKVEPHTPEVFTIQPVMVIQK